VQLAAHETQALDEVAKPKFVPLLIVDGGRIPRFRLRERQKGDNEHESERTPFGGVLRGGVVVLFLVLFIRDKFQLQPLAELGLASRRTAAAGDLILEVKDLGRIWVPVTDNTRRVGSPFTLILEKTTAVFERDAVQHQLLQSALQWLNKTVADF
jgi:hypothetical protein